MRCPAENREKSGSFQSVRKRRLEQARSSLSLMEKSTNSVVKQRRTEGRIFQREATEPFVLFCFAGTCGGNTETDETVQVDCPGTGVSTLETIPPNPCIIDPTRVARPFSLPRGFSLLKTWVYYVPLSRMHVFTGTAFRDTWLSVQFSGDRSGFRSVNTSTLTEKERERERCPWRVRKSILRR